MKTYDCPTEFGFKGVWQHRIKGGDVHFYNFYLTEMWNYHFCDCVSLTRDPIAYAHCTNCMGHGMPPIPWRDLNG
jgi:hypothetical protein